VITSPERPINDEARNDPQIASTAVRLYYRTPRVATSKTEARN